jgi:hypothetical protein
MSKFKIGDIVRKVCEDPAMDYDPVDVIGIDETTIRVQNSVGTTYTDDPNDFELITSVSDITQEPVKQVPNNPNLDEATIHSEVARMMNEVTQFVAKHVDGKSIELCIESEYYSGADLDISFNCRIGYEERIKSGNLRQSAEISLRHWQETHNLKPLSIGVTRNETS